MNLLFVSSEVAPFSQTGGLGDVCGAWPIALAQRGHRVVVVSPAYGRANDHLAWDTGVTARFWLFGEQHDVRYRVYRPQDNLAFVLIDSLCFRRSGIYGDSSGVYGDNLMRFALLCRAALEVPRRVEALADGRLGDEFVLHAHDWHAGLAPLYLRAHYHPVGLYTRCRSVLTIHNAAHQGRYAASEFGGLDLAPRHMETTLWGDTLAALKTGLVSADHVTAVSPSFARDLRTSEGGFGLDAILRRVPLTGILNGIDTSLWDPSSDKHVPQGYSLHDMAGKAACKAALQRELGLPVRPEVPLFAFVSRLDGQKGVDSVLRLAPWILEQDLQFVALGSGASTLQNGLKGMEARAPHRARAIIGFDVPLSHRIYAGADFLLVPSLFEPCGLTQLYAMRYGAIPIVRATGGLRDSVRPWGPVSHDGTGWLYDEPDQLGQAMFWAFRTWWDHPNSIHQLRVNGMSQDWSWGPAAARYEAVYQG